MIVYLTSQSGLKMSFFLSGTENGQKLRTTHKAYHWLNNISTNWKKWSSGQMWIRRVFKWVHNGVLFYSGRVSTVETHSAPLMVFYLSTIWFTAFGTILKTKTSKRESKNVSRWFRIISKSQFAFFIWIWPWCVFKFARRPLIYVLRLLLFIP